MKVDLRSEHQEQCAVVDYCKLRNIPIFAIPNAGKRNATIAKRFKNEGLESGVPDLMIPVPNNAYHGLFIEMKRIKGGKPSDNQYVWNELLNKLGYLAVFCYGFDMARLEIDKYMGDKQCTQNNK